jgi:hypothetical protein
MPRCLPNVQEQLWAGAGWQLMLMVMLVAHEAALWLEPARLMRWHALLLAVGAAALAGLTAVSGASQLHNLTSMPYSWP